MVNLYSYLPAVDAVLHALAQDKEMALLPRPLVKELVSTFLDSLRQDITAGKITDKEALGLEALLPGLRAGVRAGVRPHFRRVLNATGVVIHTNMGRSLLAQEAALAVQEASTCYSNLEFSLTTGKRGSRYSHVEGLLQTLTGAEAGLVVNNNAAAVFLVLDTLAKGREAIVSRGQLVEIGGSFRIPDVMVKSGVILREVGTTNRTHLADYEHAIGTETALLMKVHCSNYRITGFTRAVGGAELVALGRQFGLPVVEDLGSGSLHTFSRHSLDEPLVQDVVASGMDIVTFSGDKVLGGPQAGIIVGKKKWIDLIRKNPLNRALRIDKMTLAALEATLRLYLDPKTAQKSIPTLNMIETGQKELAAKAARLEGMLSQVIGEEACIRLYAGQSRVGGGAFPEYNLPTTLMSVESEKGISAETLRKRLLEQDTPLIGRIENDLFILDPRTLAEDEFPLVVDALCHALNRS